MLGSQQTGVVKEIAYKKKIACTDEEVGAVLNETMRYVSTLERHDDTCINEPQLCCCYHLPSSYHLSSLPTPILALAANFT